MYKTTVCEAVRHNMTVKLVTPCLLSEQGQNTACEGSFFCLLPIKGHPTQGLVSCYDS